MRNKQVQPASECEAATEQVTSQVPSP